MVYLKILLVGVIISLFLNFLYAPDKSPMFPFQREWWTKKYVTKSTTGGEDMNMTMFERFMSYLTSYVLIVLIILILSQ